MEEYGPPVDRLLTIREEPDFGFHDWPDYLALGFGPEHVPDLIRMATDPDLNQADPESLEVWAPVHAWRTLGQLRAEAAAVPLAKFLAALINDVADDWASEELPAVLGMIGPPAIPAASAILEDESVERDARTNAARALGEVGRRHPEARDESVAILSRSLERAEWHDPSLNGFVVSELIALEAKEAAGVIERAFAGGFVDDSIMGTWYDVWHQLDLEGEPPPMTERQYRLEFGPPDLLDEPPPVFESPLSWQPAETRTPEDRKERNKARQKLEKKAKGKARKRK